MLSGLNKIGIKGVEDWNNLVDSRNRFIALVP